MIAAGSVATRSLYRTWLIAHLSFHFILATLLLAHALHSFDIWRPPFCRKLWGVSIVRRMR